MRIKIYILVLCVAVTASSCGFLFGNKEDDSTNEIFEQGRIDPAIVPQNVGYVPVLPFFQGFVNPVDVYVGYDEMVYVVDDMGVHVLDQKGTRHRVINIPGATDVVMDRRLHLYVAGRVTQNVGGQNYNLAAVYHLTNTSTADGPYFIDTLIHPFDDLSRRQVAFRGADDEAVRFTGLVTLENNGLYVSRTGPNNSFNTTAWPDNTILRYTADGVNLGHTNGLNPVSSNLRSCLGVSAIAGFAAPPQRLFGVDKSPDFILCQADSNPSVEFRVLWIKENFDPDLGSRFYGENTALLNFDTTKSNRFLYQSFRFGIPSDVFIATDGAGYIFVTDSKTDSLYQFTRQGYEGVNPPANYPTRKQLNASFGGTGSGPFQFREPSGVCYFKRIVYVADKGNGRICRYTLSTDIE